MSDATKVRPQKAIWTCKDGRKVRICDMTDSHLLNTIAMLERMAGMQLGMEISAAYSVLAGLQGDMATFYCEQDIERMEETDPIEFLEQTTPIYEKLCIERDRRNL